MEVAKTMTGGDADKVKIAEEVFTECNISGGSDECEAASNIALCMKDSSAKKKIVLGL